MPQKTGSRLDFSDFLPIGKSASDSHLLPERPLRQPGLQRFRQFANQQRMPSGYPAMDRPAGPFGEGVFDQRVGGDVVVDQAEFVLQLR